MIFGDPWIGYRYVFDAMLEPSENVALAAFLYPRSKQSSVEVCLIVSACQLSSQLSFITFDNFLSATISSD